MDSPAMDAQFSARRDLIALAVLLGIVGHQVFRKYESYSIPVHAALLAAPPTLAAAYIGLRENSTRMILSALPLSWAAYLGALTFSVVFYRLSSFHPLSRYPGPTLGKISNFFMAFKCLPGYQHVYIRELHEKYGDVVRIGPNHLSIRDPSAVPTLLGTSNVTKGPHFLGRFLSDKFHSMVALQHEEEHMERRRPWVRGLTPTAVKAYEEQVAYRVRQLVTRMGEEKGEVCLDLWVKYFAYDFMADMAFGGGSELLSGEDKNNFWVLFDNAMRYATFTGHVPWFGVYLGFIPLAAAPLEALLTRCRELSKLRVERGSGTKNDLFQFLTNEDMPDTDVPAPTMKQLTDDGIVTIIAGTDTVASALTSLFCCLFAHPEVYEKLQAEIDHFYPPGEDAAEATHHREMTYLTAVINETLRLFPPVPGCTQRQEPHDGPGTTSGSIVIPPGTNFWVHAWSMHRDARNFSPAAEGFWPERWLFVSGRGKDALAQRKDKDAPVYNAATFVHNESAYVPFSHGPMNCVGKNLALQEIRGVVCALIQRYKIRPQDASWSLKAYEREFRDYFVTTRAKVPVILEERTKA